VNGELLRRRQSSCSAARRWLDAPSFVDPTNVLKRCCRKWHRRRLVQLPQPRSLAYSSLHTDCRAEEGLAQALYTAPKPPTPCSRHLLQASPCLVGMPSYPPIALSRSGFLHMIACRQLSHWPGWEHSLPRTLPLPDRRVATPKRVPWSRIVTHYPDQRNPLRLHRVWSECFTEYLRCCCHCRCRFCSRSCTQLATWISFEQKSCLISTGVRCCRRCSLLCIHPSTMAAVP